MIIGTLSYDGAIAVFLDKWAIALAAIIVALYALAIFVFLNRSTMTHTIFILGLEL